MKIISGGQTGVDRAALDQAMDMGITVGGWCPRDRAAEDGSIPDKYPLIEMNSRSYETRTRMNIARSDHTLILFSGPKTPGTKLTWMLCQQLEKPFTEVDLSDVDSVDVERVRDAIADVDTLNVAGPRESKRPGIYTRAREFLAQILEKEEDASH